MQRKCQGCNKTFTPPNYTMMRCRSCAKGVGYPKEPTEAEIKELHAHVMYVELSFWEPIDAADSAHLNVEK